MIFLLTNRIQQGKIHWRNKVPKKISLSGRLIQDVGQTEQEVEMPKTVKAAVIGAGMMGKHHVNGFLGAGADVCAVCDTHIQRAEALSKEHGIKPFSDYRKMLRELPDLDAVSIGVPNKFHKQVSLAAIKNGKHVICEKPMAMNAREAGEMLNKAKEKNLIFALHIQRRFRYSTRWLKKEVEKGSLGKIYHIRVAGLRVNGIPKGWFHVKKFSGGGALIDLAPHSLDMAWAIAGKPRPISVSGYSYSKLGSRGIGFGKWGVGHESGHDMDTDDLSGGLIRFAGGMTMELCAAWALHLDEKYSECTFFGDKAGAKIDTKARIYSQNKKFRQKVQPEGKDITPFDDFVKCVRTGSKPEASGEDGLMVMKMIDAIYKSARIGKEVRI